MAAEVKDEAAQAYGHPWLCGKLNNWLAKLYENHAKATWIELSRSSARPGSHSRDAALSQKVVQSVCWRNPLHFFLS